MLKGLDPLLPPDLLHALAAMGHGDELALVDRNYPATSTSQRLIRLEWHRACSLADQPTPLLLEDAPCAHIRNSSCCSP